MIGCFVLNKPFLSLIKPHIGEKEIIHDIDNLIEKFSEVFTDKIGKALNLSVAEGYKCCKFILNPVTLHKVKNILREWSEQDIIKPSTSEVLYISPA